MTPNCSYGNLTCLVDMGILLRVQGSYLTYITLGEEWHTVLQVRGRGISFIIMFPFQICCNSFSVCIAWSLSNFPFGGHLCLVSTLDLKGVGLWEVIIKALFKYWYWKFSEIKNPLLLAIACKLFYDMYLAVLTCLCFMTSHVDTY